MAETPDLSIKFSSYSALLQYIRDFEQKNYVQLNRVYAKKLSAPCVVKKYPNKVQIANRNLEYYNLTYMCVNGGKYKYSGSQKRKTSTSKLGCPMFMRFRLSADCQTLEMADYNITHTHPINQELYNMMPKQRRLSDNEKEEAEKFIKLKCNKKMIKHYIKMNTGKIVTLKDLSNLKVKQNDFKDNELIKTIEFLKTDPTSDVELFVNDRKELEGIYYQDSKMKKSFEAFPEILLCDATYKLNNLRLPLYILMVVNGNGNGEVAATFLLVNETETSLSRVMTHFKEKNSAWENTISIFTDKDLKERHVFEKEFPKAQLLICLFHTLKTFRTTITMQKMNIKNEERQQCLNILQKITYSKNEEEYQQNYDKFLNLKLNKVIDYFNSNWHNIRHQWVEGLKKQNFTLNISTTNHLESFNQKIKQVVTRMSDLRSFFGDFLILLDTIRDEYARKAADMATKKLIHDYDVDSSQAKYIDLLTPFAFSFVEKCLSNYKLQSNDPKWQTTTSECNCIFRKNMKLPCKHIFYARELCNLNLFDENLVDERYKKLNYIAHNTNTSSSYDNPCLSGKSISISQIPNKKALTNNEKYRKTMDICQEIASCASECGTQKFEKITDQLAKFLQKIKQGKDDLVIEDKAMEFEVEEQAEIPCNEEMSYIPELEIITTATVEMEDKEKPNIMSVNLLKNVSPALLDHCYCNTMHSSADEDVKITRANSICDIKDIRYKHLKLKRIGRPKGADHTIIGLKKKCTKKQKKNNN